MIKCVVHYKNFFSSIKLRFEQNEDFVCLFCFLWTFNVLIFLGRPSTLITKLKGSCCVKSWDIYSGTKKQDFIHTFPFVKFSGVVASRYWHVLPLKSSFSLWIRLRNISRTPNLFSGIESHVFLNLRFYRPCKICTYLLMTQTWLELTFQWFLIPPLALHLNASCFPNSSTGHLPLYPRRVHEWKQH